MSEKSKTPENLKPQIYAIRVDLPDGSTLFPTYVSTEEADWQKQTDAAEKYFKNQYSQYGGITSFTIGDDFLGAGVNNSQSILSWSEIKEKLES